MKGFINKYWPPIVASTVLLGIALYQYDAVVKINDGTFVYALDDAYIHMAIAKNVVEHGVWGVTQYAFTASSSSPLWTVLLSILYKILGVQTIIPYLLNCVFGVAVLCISAQILSRYILNKTIQFSFLMLLIVMVPLPIQIVSGMEHMMHIFLVLVFVYLCSKTFVQMERGEQLSSGWKVLSLVTALMVLARYESLFIVAAVVCILLVHKKIKEALMLLSAAIIPVVIVGIQYIVHGWYFLPNSILVKTRAAEETGIFSTFSHNIHQITTHAFEAQIIFLLFLCLALALYAFHHREIKGTPFKSFLLWGVTVSTILHLLFARVGWLFRYEAYLIVIGLIAVCIFWDYSIILKKSSLGGVLSGGMVGILLVVLFIPRIQVSLYAITAAPRNIYEQHYQLGRFMSKYYDNESIAATDIGAIAYYSGSNLVDLLGLADKAIGTAMIRGNTLRDVTLAQLREEQVSVAVAYTSYIETVIATSDDSFPWIRVGGWEIVEANLLARHTVHFYAMGDDEVEKLKESLREFNPSLPPSVSAVIYN